MIKLNLFLQCYFYTNTYLETDFQNFHQLFSCFCLLNLIQEIKTERRGVLGVIVTAIGTAHANISFNKNSIGRLISLTDNPKVYCSTK